MKKTFLIVAGGSGKRMLSGIPKQFLLLAGKPILMRTLEIFHRVDPSAKIIVVLPANHFEHWKALCEDYRFHLPHILAAGGITRFESVKSGLAMVEDDVWVAIHDGVRPLITTSLIRKLLEAAEKHGNAVPGLTVTESLRRLEPNKNYPVPREEYFSVQTPQVFRSTEIKQAYLMVNHSNFTDDATVLETLGFSIHLQEGDPNNIKITNLIDLVLAETILSKRH
ncbi:MAG: 2-C-methyl-D-erythritol 4-phosphate cytidylyltransferase [Bacteroidales bacterium]